MSNKHYKILKQVYWISAIILVFIILSVVWLYSGTLTQGKIKIFQTLPLPMALVNWHPIPMKDFLVRFGAAQKTLSQNNEQQIKFAIVQKLIMEAEVSQLAAQRGVSASAQQINQEYLILSDQTNLQGQRDFKNFLQNQGLNEYYLKNNVIKPKLLLERLQIWFNSQPNLNSRAYRLANNLLEQINGGGDMAVLAGQFTEDPAGKGTGGDMGFVQITDLSGELRESASALKPGDVKIISGLGGLYIIRLEEQTGNRLHLREIFLNADNFNAWLDSQTEKFKVIILWTKKL